MTHYHHYAKLIMSFSIVIQNTVAGYFVGMISGASLMIINHHYIDNPWPDFPVTHQYGQTEF